MWNNKSHSEQRVLLNARKIHSNKTVYICNKNVSKYHLSKWISIHNCTEILLTFNKMDYSTTKYCLYRNNEEWKTEKNGIQTNNISYLAHTRELCGVYCEHFCKDNHNIYDISKCHCTYDERPPMSLVSTEPYVQLNKITLHALSVHPHRPDVDIK